jgi:alkyl hydroperoxide reductase subunit AhpC
VEVRRSHRSHRAFRHPTSSCSRRRTRKSRSQTSAGVRRSSPSIPKTGARFAPTSWRSIRSWLSEFQRFDAELLGISVDGIWCHLAFARDRNLHFPLLSDFEPKGEVARRYGAYRAEDGTTERALFVIDGEGSVRWSYVSPVGINPGADGILRALEGLKTEDGS